MRKEMHKERYNECLVDETIITQCGVLVYDGRRMREDCCLLSRILWQRNMRKICRMGASSMRLPCDPSTLLVLS